MLKFFTIANTLIGVVVLILLLRTPNTTYVGSPTQSLDSLVVSLRAQVQELSTKDFSDPRVKRLESLVESLGTKLSAVHGVTTVSVESKSPIHGTVVNNPMNPSTPIIPFDTTGFLSALPDLDDTISYHYEGSNLTFDGKSSLRTGESIANYRYWATLNVVSHTKHRFLRPDLDLMDVTIDDPNAELSVSSFEFPRKNLFDVSVQLGYGVSKTGFSPYLGLGVSKKIFSINRK